MSPHLWLAIVLTCGASIMVIDLTDPRRHKTRARPLDDPGAGAGGLERIQSDHPTEEEKVSEHPERPWRVERRHTTVDPVTGEPVVSWEATDVSRFASKEAAEAHQAGIATLDASELRVERAVHFEASE